MATMQTKPAASDALRSISEASGQGGRVLADAAASWLNASSEYQREVISFLSKRLEKDGETVRRMTSCKTLGDVAEIQSRWIEDAWRDYNSEMTRLMSLYTTSPGITRARVL